MIITPPPSSTPSFWKWFWSFGLIWIDSASICYYVLDKSWLQNPASFFLSPFVYLSLSLSLSLSIYLYLSLYLSIYLSISLSLSSFLFSTIFPFSFVFFVSFSVLCNYAIYLWFGKKMLNITSFIICPKNPKSKIDSNLSLVYLYFICIVQRQVLFGVGDSVGNAFLGSACHSSIMVFCFISSVYKGSTSFHNWKIALILC